MEKRAIVELSTTLQGAHEKGPFHVTEVHSPFSRLCKPDNPRRTGGMTIPYFLAASYLQDGCRIQWQGAESNCR